MSNLETDLLWWETIGILNDFSTCVGRVTAVTGTEFPFPHSTWAARNTAVAMVSVLLPVQEEFALTEKDT